MTKLKIDGMDFEVQAPYEEGHTLNAAEASQLNQVYRENIRNNFASAVKKAREEAGEGGTPDQTTLQSQLDEYVKTYAFGVRKVGTGGGLPSDPVDRRAVIIARERVRAQIKAKGMKVAADKINELADLLVQRNPEIKREAQRQLKAMDKIAGETLDLESLGLTAADQEQEQPAEDQAGVQAG